MNIREEAVAHIKEGAHRETEASIPWLEEQTAKLKARNEELGRLEGAIFDAAVSVADPWATPAFEWFRYERGMDKLKKAVDAWRATQPAEQAEGGEE